GLRLCRGVVEVFASRINRTIRSQQIAQLIPLEVCSLIAISEGARPHKGLERLHMGVAPEHGGLPAVASVNPRKVSGGRINVGVALQSRSGEIPVVDSSCAGK